MAETTERVDVIRRAAALMWDDGYPCDVVNDRLPRLERRLTQLEERVQGIAETNNLWDGS